MLRERVSIRNLEVICEVLCDYGPRTKDTDVLTEYVRHALARTICAPLVDENNKLRIVTLSPSLEQEILDAVKRGEGGEYIPVSPQRSQQICENTAKAIQRLVLEGYEPIVVCTANVRRFLYRILERKLPKVRVLSYNEIDSSVKVEIEGQIEV